MGLLLLSGTAPGASGQSRGDIGAYPPPPLGSPPPQPTSPRPRLGPVLEDKADDYCRSNPGACNVRRPDGHEILRQPHEEQLERERRRAIQEEQDRALARPKQP
ncbi:MAG: hypothetical protein KIT81_16415 [Alphaproteobacteria bacterium]|nr:hypothetical protein [Alphaproteobacteria bacterium]